MTQAVPRTEQPTESSTAWAVAFRQAPMGIIVCDIRGGTIVLVNDYTCRFLGRGEDELLGHSIIGLIHPVERAYGLSRWASTLVDATGRLPDTSDRARVPFRAADGSAVWADVMWTMTTPDADGVQYAALYVTRIAEEKAAPDDLAEISQRFKIAFELATVGIAVLDLDGRFRQANKAMQKLLGHTEDELKQMSFPDINHPSEQDASTRTFEAMIEGRIEQHETIKRYIASDGRTLYCRRIAALTRDAAGKPSYLMLMAEPIDLAGVGSEEAAAGDAARDADD
jgi:PAS domain S-box-containing protein